MSNQKEKKPSIDALAKKAIRELYESSGRSLWLVAQIDKFRLSVYKYAAVDKVGIEIYEYNEKYETKVIRRAKYEWSMWKRVVVDHYFMKSVFTFIGENENDSVTITTLEKGKELANIITGQVGLPLQVIPRPWWRKIVGFRSKTKWKMAVASVFYLLLFVAAVSAFTDDSPDAPASSEQASSQTASTQVQQTNAKPQSQPPSQQSTQAQKQVVVLMPAVVTRVIDGDTFETTINCKTERVRMIGVDTPESTKNVEPFGKEASEFTKKQLTGKKVYLELDAQERDKYGRLLAYVWLEPPSKIDDTAIRQKMFNARLLLDGYATVMTVPPNVKYEAFFVKYNWEARDANRGLWTLDDKPQQSTQQIASRQTADYKASEQKGSEQKASEQKVSEHKVSEHKASEPAKPRLRYDPNGPDRDCSDFASQAEAQAFFEAAGPGDPHRLDRDGDGIACE